MGRRQTMMEKFKQQMKAYRKQKMKKNNTPYLPVDGVVYVMDCMDAEKKYRAEVLKTYTIHHRKVIENLACPICGSSMDWDSRWEAFICDKHGKKAIYELVSGD